MGIKTGICCLPEPVIKHLSIQLLNGRYSSEINFEIAEYNCFIADQFLFSKGLRSSFLFHRNLTQDIMWFLHVQVLWGFSSEIIVIYAFKK